MSLLFTVHSSLRFLVLLVGFAVVGACLLGLARRMPFSKLGRILGASFAGLLHLQVLVGIAVVFTGLWVPRDIGHVVMMLAAAVAAQVMMSLNRRAATPNWSRPLIGVGLALLLVVGGLMAIGRRPWTITAFATPEATTKP